MSDLDPRRILVVGKNVKRADLARRFSKQAALLKFFADVCAGPPDVVIENFAAIWPADRPLPESIIIDLDWQGARRAEARLGEDGLYHTDRGKWRGAKPPPWVAKGAEP